MQFFWLYIDDLVGKGLDFLTIMQLVGLVAINTITLSLPLSLLFSSIMTFGNLGESFELETQLIIAFRTGILPEEKFSLLSLVIAELQKMVSGFKNTVEANPY